MPAYAYILSADVGIHGHQVRKFYGKGGYIMTLKELVDNVTIDAQIVDIYAWDEDKDDYVFCVGFDNDSGDLGGDLLYVDDDMRDFLLWEVSCIESYMDSRKAVLRIELAKPQAKEDGSLVWCVDWGTGMNNMIHSDLFLTEAEADAFCELHKGDPYCVKYRTHDIWNFRKKHSA